MILSGTQGHRQGKNEEKRLPLPWQSATFHTPLASRNWRKQRVCHHSLKDWNTLDNETRNSPNIAIFKRSVHSRFL